jgi:hypothetical protein
VLNRHLLDSLGRRSLITAMRIFRQFGVLVLLLVSCMAPAMACMVPDAQMNTGVARLLPENSAKRS